MDHFKVLLTGNDADFMLLSILVSGLHIRPPSPTR